MRLWASFTRRFGQMRKLRIPKKLLECRTRPGGDRGATPSGDPNCPRLLGIFMAWRLRAYSLGIATVYAVVFFHFFRGGGWIININRAPIYTDFTTAWVAGLQALHGNVAALYNSTEFVNIQTALLGPLEFVYPNWPYPPPFFLLLAPFALLPYFWAFLAWDLITLLGCVSIVYLIVRRSPAIALVLASPFTAWNFLAGQNGFLLASLLGAALLFLERQPTLAGVFIGCLTYKPQFGILLPIALLAANQWRAIASAIATVALLAAASIAAFGASAWEAFPRGLFQQFGIVVGAEGEPLFAVNWGYIQSVYGLVRYLHGSAGLAWLAQGSMTLFAALLVWMFWRSPLRYALKAALLSIVVLLATPYVFAYDLAALSIPVAFFAKDQMRSGVLRGEQTVLLGLFCSVLALLVALTDPRIGTTFGSIPIGPAVLIVLLGLVLRRAISANSTFAGSSWFRYLRPLRISKFF